jgi:hypothetical protein
MTRIRRIFQQRKKGVQFQPGVFTPAQIIHYALWNPEKGNPAGSRREAEGLIIRQPRREVATDKVLEFQDIRAE